MTKITKMWLAKVAAIFTYTTSLLHRISPPASFYSKTKIGYIFSLYSSFGVFIFTFSILIFTFGIHVWVTYFLHYKEQWEQSKMYYWRRKIKQILCEEWYHINCSFKRNNSGIFVLQLSVSLFSGKIHSVKEEL